MKRIAIESAYLLANRPFRESSALLEVFSRMHGRVGLVARGVRGSRSKLRGQLQPFCRLLVSWVERGELGTLTSAEPDPGPAKRFEPPLAGEALFAGWYVNELLLRLLPRRDPHPDLFADYEGVLARLAEGGTQPALRVFEKRLLSRIGYGLRLPDDCAGDGWYEFDADSALRRVTAATPGAYRGSSLLALACERLETVDALDDARRLLREALARHLGGRELETPRLLRSLRRAVKSPDAGHA